MNPDPVPPVRPLLTHVITDGPLRREAGVKSDTNTSHTEGRDVRPHS